MSLPLWQQIRDRLTAEVSDGRYPPGARLPSEARLAARFGVNRHTVRRALAEMQKDALVHARRGSGVFVTGTHISYRVGRRTRFSQNLAEAGHTSSREILRLETVPASAEDAEKLQIRKDDPVHLVETVAAADAVPIVHGQSIFPAARLPAFPEALEDSLSITRALCECGITDYRRLTTRLSAERVDGVLARHLHLPHGALILRAVSDNVDPDGRPIEHGTACFAADRVELVIDQQSFG